MKQFLIYVKISLLILIGVSFSQSVMATSVISTAPGGTFTSGYQGGNLNFGTDGSIIGHVMFKNGFKIPATKIVTWDAEGIVNGPLVMGTYGNSNNGMTLRLFSDLRLGSTSRLLGSTADRLLKLSTLNSTIFLSTDTSFYNCIAPILISGATSGNLTIDGQGNQLTLTSTRSSQTSAAFDSNLNAGMSLTLKNMRLVFDSNNAAVSTFFRGNGDANSNLTLENVAVYSVPYANSIGIFNSGSSTLTIRGNVSFDSPGGVIGLVSSGNPRIVIEKNSTLRVGKNTIFTFCKGGSIGAFTMADQTSVLHLDGCDFYASASGGSFAQLNLLGGTVLFENKVRIFNAYYATNPSIVTDMNTPFNLGDGLSVANDVNVRVLGGAYVTVSGAMKYNHS
jgi:hypothetical protein